MKNRRGAITAILTVGALVVVGVTAIFSSLNLNKKQTTSSKAADVYLSCNTQDGCDQDEYNGLCEIDSCTKDGCSNNLWHCIKKSVSPPPENPAQPEPTHCCKYVSCGVYGCPKSKIYVHVWPKPASVTTCAAMGGGVGDCKETYSGGEQEVCVASPSCTSGGELYPTPNPSTGKYKCCKVQPCGNGAGGCSTSDPKQAWVTWGGEYESPCQDNGLQYCDDYVGITAGAHGCFSCENGGGAAKKPPLCGTSDSGGTCVAASQCGGSKGTIITDQGCANTAQTCCKVAPPPIVYPSGCVADIYDGDCRLDGSHPLLKNHPSEPGKTMCCVAPSKPPLDDSKKCKVSTLSKSSCNKFAYCVSPMKVNPNKVYYYSKEAQKSYSDGTCSDDSALSSLVLYCCIADDPLKPDKPEKCTIEGQTINPFPTKCSTYCTGGNISEFYQISTGTLFSFYRTDTCAFIQNYSTDGPGGLPIHSSTGDLNDPYKSINQHCLCPAPLDKEKKTIDEPVIPGDVGDTTPKTTADCKLRETCCNAADYGKRINCPSNIKSSCQSYGFLGSIDTSYICQSHIDECWKNVGKCAIAGQQTMSTTVNVLGMQKVRANFMTASIVNVCVMKNDNDFSTCKDFTAEFNNSMVGDTFSKTTSFSVSADMDWQFLSFQVVFKSGESYKDYRCTNRGLGCFLPTHMSNQSSPDFTLNNGTVLQVSIR